MTQELVRWSPLPRSLSAVFRTLKDIKQSVVEVIRVLSIEVHVGSGISDEDCTAQVVIESPQHKIGRFCCRRRRYAVYGGFTVPLEKSGEGLLTSPPANYDCRILALHRRSGDLQISVQVLSRNKSTSQRSFRKSSLAPQVFSRYEAALPSYTASPEWQVEMKAVEYPSHIWSSAGLGNSFARVNLRAMQANQVFSTSRCKPNPKKYSGRDEWRPTTPKHWANVWTSPWSDDDVANLPDLMNSMSAEMKNSIVLAYQTLFSQSLDGPPWRPSLSKEEEEAHDRRVLFLKRLYLTIAACKLTFCTEENGTLFRRWPFPLASSLGHGSRIMVRLDGVPWQDFLNLLLFGDPKCHHWTGEDAVPSPFWARWAASHSVGLSSDSGRLYERRLKTGDVVRNVTDGLLGHHLGMDLPIGGLGNRAPSDKNDPLFVGPAGVPFRRMSSSPDAEPTYAEDIQNGHLYLRWDDFGVKPCPVLALDTGGSRPPPKRRSRRFSTAFGEGLPFSPAATVDSGVSTESHGTSMAVEHRASALLTGEWKFLPSIGTLADLQAVLKEHAYSDVAKNQGRALEKLYKLLVLDGELALQSDGQGHLQLQGVLIHLLLNLEGEAEDKVLVHISAEAAVELDQEEKEQQQPRLVRGLSKMSQFLAAGRGSRVDLSAEGSREKETRRQQDDLRVAAELRRRHEPWTEALQRLCRNQLQLSTPAFEKVMKRCNRAMSGEAYANGETEMFVYPCEGPPSLCQGHSFLEDFGLPVRYQAYRFTVKIKKKDRPLFLNICQDTFDSVEHNASLDHFGGALAGRRGAIRRHWAWKNCAEALEANIPGMALPEERMHIAYETAQLSAILIGIESSAPHKVSFFGGKHGLSGESKDMSPFGTRKWRDYRRGGQEVPADVGGMRLQIDPQVFAGLVSLFQSLPLAKPSAGPSTDSEALFERKLFRALLVASDEEAEEILRVNLGFVRPSLHRLTGTMVINGDIKERLAEGAGAGAGAGDAAEVQLRPESVKSAKPPAPRHPTTLDDSEEEQDDEEEGLPPQPPAEPHRDNPRSLEAKVAFPRELAAQADGKGRATISCCI